MENKKYAMVFICNTTAACYGIHTNKDYGSVEYWSENDKINNFEAYSIIIKEIDEN